MGLEFFFAWWNLLFELVFLLALIYTLLLAFGVGDSDQNTDLDVAADIDTDAGLNTDFGQGMESLEAAPDASAVTHAIGFLGVGRVPVSIIVVTFCYLFGVAGWTSNQLFSALRLPPLLFVWLSIVLALVVSIGLTRALALGLAHILPSTESYGVEKGELVGRIAEVRYPISHTFGAAQVRDQYGNLHQVDCRIGPADGEIPAGTRVVLLDYDETCEVFGVLTEEQLEARVR
jgi:hypothetical protein